MQFFAGERALDSAPRALILKDFDPKRSDFLFLGRYRLVTSSFELFF